MAVETRNEILDAADGLFGSVGFHAATTREISELSGANKALIHYHFGGKEGLFESVLDRYYERLTAAIMTALEGKGDLRAKMNRLVDAYIDFLVLNPDFFRIVQREASGGKQMERIAKKMVDIMAVAMPAVREAYPVTASGPLSAEHLAVTFYGAIITYFSYARVLEEMLGADPLSKAKIAERKVHIHWLLATAMDTLEAQQKAQRKGKKK